MAFSDVCKASRTDIEMTALAIARDEQEKTSSISWHKIGHNAANELLARPTITGVFCINDDVAKGLYDALVEQGRRVPEDISIIACDNNYDYLTTGFTTISLECHQAGTMAAEIIARRLHGEKAIIWPELHLVKPLLIPRKTVKNLNIVDN
jgi:LacI family transcriptional regulator